MEVKLMDRKCLQLLFLFQNLYQDPLVAVLLCHDVRRLPWHVGVVVLRLLAPHHEEDDPLSRADAPSRDLARQKDVATANPALALRNERPLKEFSRDIKQ